MALTGPRLLANVYAINGQAISGATALGRRNWIAFNEGVSFYDAPPNTTVGAVTISSIIEVLPTGLNQPSKKYYCVETPAQLISGSA